MKIINVVGARPNFMKMASLMAAYRSWPGIEPILVHTGQHYDRHMSELFFEQLGIPRPDVNLAVGSASHAVQTAEIMKAFEPVVLRYRPDAVVVVGDVNSTIACGLVAAKLGVRLMHVEAGLRSFDRAMPEEINRVLTDAISDLLFCTESSAVRNLAAEGIAAERVHLVGNVMIDTLLNNRRAADGSKILERLHVAGGRYAVLTLHRPSNVDRPDVLAEIMAAVEAIAAEVPVIFPIHPRTRARLADSPAGGRLEDLAGLKLIDPLGYLDFLKLMAEATVVLTDSGGIQEETTILAVPCLTLRDNTERPVTVEVGTNRIVGTRSEAILAAWREIRSGRSGRSDRSSSAGLAGATAPDRTPPLWDGKAAARIAAIMVDSL